jgi:hypothetical protein
MAARGEREGICDLGKQMGIDAATERTGRNRHCPARRSQTYAGTYRRRDFLPLSSDLSGGGQESHRRGKALPGVIDLLRPMAIRQRKGSKRALSMLAGLGWLESMWKP